MIYEKGIDLIMKLFIREGNIDESARDELYRIAENELLPETELYKISEYCTIDEDSFDFTQTGTAWGGYICYDIYMEWTAEYLPRIGDFYRNNIDDVWHRDWKLNEIKIYFNIHVDGSNLKTLKKYLILMLSVMQLEKLLKILLTTFILRLADIMRILMNLI